MSAEAVRSWLRGFELAAKAEVRGAEGPPPDGAWALSLSISMIDAARASLPDPSLVEELRAAENAAVSDTWNRLRAAWKS